MVFINSPARSGRRRIVAILFGQTDQNIQGTTKSDTTERDIFIKIYMVTTDSRHLIG